MLFNSWPFLTLLLITLPLYYLPFGGSQRRVWQVGLLLAASAVFYAWEEPRLLILLGLSCLGNAIAVERILFWKAKGLSCLNSIIPPSSTGGFVCPSLRKDILQDAIDAEGRALGHCGTDRSHSSDSKARLWLFWTVALNLGFLAFFKYAGFISALLPETQVTKSLTQWATGIPLPVGISFYTFQGISLVVDVWRSDISAHTTRRLSARGVRRSTSIADTSFYIAFFPQLVAGPIVKAHEFVDQIGAKYFHDIDWMTVRRGLISGYFLKVFVADNLAENTITLSAPGFNLAGAGPISLGSMLYGYSLQIFADFAGYSLIAIGLGALFGYHLPPNFNFPYLSTSITEFWRRWHLSLSSWLRDYLYIPLGGNRKGTGRTYFNLFLVMFLGGLWHGAAWKFALWGSLHGVFLALERLAGSALRKHDSALSQGRQFSLGGATGHRASSPNFAFTSFLKHFVKWLVTFHLVTFLWLAFMMPDLASIRAFFVGLSNAHLGFSGPPIFSLLFYGSVVVLYHVWGWLREHRKQLAGRLSRSQLEPLLHGAMIFLIITNPGAPRGFIYFQF